MQILSDYIKKINNICNREKTEVYMVGGAVRDYFINQKTEDIDLVLNRRVEKIARYFADDIKGSLVILDESRQIFRVVIKDGIIFDFTKMTGNNIEEDLLSRDFTINAIGISLNELVNKDLENIFSFNNISNKLIDPTGGLTDLQERKLEVVSDGVFRDDPLRIWRALRFRVVYGFGFTKRLEKLLIRDYSLSNSAAAERIHKEIVEIFREKKIAEVIADIEDKFNLISALVNPVDALKQTGKNKYHSENAWKHSCLALKELEKVLEKLYFSKLISEKNIYMLKLAALFHDIGKVKARHKKGDRIHYYGHEKVGADVMKYQLRRLKFSRSEIKYITGIIRYHMRPMMLYLADNLTIKGKVRFYRDAGKLSIPVLVLSLADKTSSMLINKRDDEIVKYRNFIKGMLAEYDKYTARTEILLLTGADIIELFNLSEGPEIGRLLIKVKTAQALDIIKTRDEAVAYLKNIIN
ncbi:MAG: HD domain-containing protein [Halothermotrichaceae bacterium]